MSTLDVASFDPNPGLRQDLPSDDLVAQIANELFTGIPASHADVVSEPTSIPSIGGGPTAPFAVLSPSFGDAPLEAALVAAPGVPGIGGGPAEPITTRTPTLGDIPSDLAVGAAPAFGGGAIPTLDAASIDTGFTPPTYGNVPAVGEGAFLTDIPHGVDAGIPVIHEDTGAINGVPERSFSSELPVGEADLLGLALGGLTNTGLPSPTDAGSQFYFLPSAEIPNAEASEHKAFDIRSVRNDFPALHQKVHGKQLVWLDNAATTHKPQSVIDALSYFYAHDNSNIHRGDHTLADRATNAHENARETIQRYLGASSPAEIIFTRGSTEAINLVSHSYGGSTLGPGDEVLISQLEHHSNIVPWQFICKEKGATLRVIPIDDQGQVRLEEYEKFLGPRTKIVSIAQVSNVLGTVLPINLITQMAHRYGARVLVDGAQGAPHLPTNVQALDADFYVLSGHKLFAPTGIGVLYGKKELLEAMPPYQGGGSMIESVSFEKTTFSPLPAKFEAGTPHIAGAVGLGAAIDYVNRYGIESIAAYEEGVMAYATAALDTIPGLRQIGTTPGKVGALAFVIDGTDTKKVGRFLDSEGIAVRAGHHCAQPSLQRYGLEASVRASLSLYNSVEDIDALVAALRKVKSIA